MQATLVINPGRRITYTVPMAERPIETIKRLVAHGRNVVQAFEGQHPISIEIDAECRDALFAYRKAKWPYLVTTPKDTFDGVPLIVTGA